MHRVIRKHVSAPCRFLNLYGCTEAAGDSTCFEVSPDFSLKDYHPPAFTIHESLPLGHPISHSCVFLLEPATEQNDEMLNIVDFGESSESRDQRIGEICVAGRGLFYESGMAPSSHSTSAFVEWSKESLQTAMEGGHGIWSDDWRPAESKITLFRTGDLGCIDSTGLVNTSHRQSIIYGDIRIAVVLWPSRSSRQNLGEVCTAARNRENIEETQIRCRCRDRFPRP